MTPMPKPQKKRVICTPQVKKLATKKPKVSTPAPVIDLTIEVEHQIPATAIVEEIPNTTTSAIHQSRESSPQTASTSATVSELFPFGHKRISAEAEVQSTGRKEGATSTLEMPPTESTTPMLGLDPLAGRRLDSSWQGERTGLYLPAPLIKITVPLNPSITPTTPQFTPPSQQPSQQEHSPASHFNKSIASYLPLQQ